MKNKKIILTAIVFNLLLSGCANLFKYQPYAREVKRKSAQGGVIALRVGHQQEDRDLADTLMQKTCAGYKINVLEEGEVAVGTTTSGSTASRKGEKSYTKFGKLKFDTSTDDTSETTTQTTELREWRIEYSCVQSKAAKI